MTGGDDDVAETIRKNLILQVAAEDLDPESFELTAVDQRSVTILRRRLGGDTLEEIGEQVGLTRERVRQIIKRHGGEEFDRLLKSRKKASSDHVRADQEVLREYIWGHPGVTFAELEANFGLPESEIRETFTRLDLKLVDGFGGERVRNQIWSDEKILSSLRVAATHFFPLTTGNYESLIAVGELEGPSVPLISQRFGTWTNACQLAGVESVESKTIYNLKWTEGEVLKFVGDFLMVLGSSNSIQAYEEWRLGQSEEVPSTAHIRNVFGTWPEARDLALAQKRSETWGASSD